MTAQFREPEELHAHFREILMDLSAYQPLKDAHAAGAWILGVEHDGRMHIITDPEWTCPASRYLAVVPYALVDQHPAEAPVAFQFNEELSAAMKLIRTQAATIARVRALADGNHERDVYVVGIDELRAALEGK